MAFISNADGKLFICVRLLLLQKFLRFGALLGLSLTSFIVVSSQRCLSSSKSSLLSPLRAEISSSGRIRSETMNEHNENVIQMPQYAVVGRKFAKFIYKFMFIHICCVKFIPTPSRKCEINKFFISLT